MDKADLQEKLFIAEYTRHFNASRAARALGYTMSQSHQYGKAFMRRPRVRAAIEQAIDDRVEGLKLHGGMVLDEWLKVIQADPNEIMHVRRSCCRHCWGLEFGYQRTQGEYAKAVKAYKKTPESLTEEFDSEGGVGYDPTRDPNPECPECFGEGVERVYLEDTRDLSPNARALLAGMKQTKDGVEVKLHSKEKALELVAKHLGMLNEKVDVKGVMSLLVATGVPNPGEELAG